VHRRSHRRHRQPARGRRRRARDRARRVVHDRLRLVHFLRRDRLRGPDCDHDREAERPPRARPGGEGLMSDPASKPRIGVDEWVASHEGRREQPAGVPGAVRTSAQRVPAPVWFLAFIVAAAMLPFLTTNGYVLRVGFDTLIFMLLALGLNTVVGYAGLLDL